MKVNFNTSYNLYPNTSFRSKKAMDDAVKKRKEKQIIIAKTKEVISKCTTVAVGITILYFAMKRNFQHNGVINEEKKLLEQVKKSTPTFTVNTDLLKPFLQ